jgi:hypothetical protein
MKETITSTITQHVNNAVELLDENPEWIKRYSGYVKEINKMTLENKRCRRLFRVKTPLYAYTSISKSKQSRCEYDLRYKGQSVGLVQVGKKDQVFLCINDAKKNSNSEFFNLKLEGKFEWLASEAQDFRRHFYNIDSIPKSPEHALENKILAVFGKRKSDSKPIRNIQPVKLNGQFFQFPTPFSASDKTLKYSGSNGGGIDILARKAKKLTVIELKDENKPAESVDTVILQAVAYATFVAKLLSIQPEWLKILGYTKDAPKEINVLTLMPVGEEKASFEGMRIDVGNYTLVLNTLYFDDDKLSFSGSFLE